MLVTTSRNSSLVFGISTTYGHRWYYETDYLRCISCLLLEMYCGEANTVVLYLTDQRLGG